MAAYWIPLQFYVILIFAAGFAGRDALSGRAGSFGDLDRAFEFGYGGGSVLFAGRDDSAAMACFCLRGDGGYVFCVPVSRHGPNESDGSGGGETGADNSAGLAGAGNDSAFSGIANFDSTYAGSGVHWLLLQLRKLRSGLATVSGTGERGESVSDDLFWRHVGYGGRSYEVPEEILPAWQVYQCDESGENLCIAAVRAGQMNDELGQHPE